jgi:hypothetical protein
MAKKARGVSRSLLLNYLEHLLDVIDKIIPIVNPDLEKIWDEHTAAYPTMEWTAKSPNRKFQELICKKIQQMTRAVLLMFVRPGKFQGKLLLLPMG